MLLDASDAARARRAAAVRRWEIESGAILVAAGFPVPVQGTDQFHDFHAHGEYIYLTGLAVAGSVVAFDPHEGWTLFAPAASAEDRVWTGEPESPESLAARSGVDDVRPNDALAAWLEDHRGVPLALLGNPDLRWQPKIYGLGAWSALESGPQEELSARLSRAISELRRAKGPWELDLMAQAAAATRRGHLAALHVARAGMSERRLQVELEAEFFRAGAERTAYGSIVASGPNAAVLHFAPTNRRLGDGDLVLVDAGAECQGYASDVTRTFPVSSSFSGLQRDLYTLVLQVQEDAIAAVRPGKEYKDLHLEAAASVADGLVQLGILRGAADSLVERDAHALFFPHGLGHLLGLATHDAGGCLAGRTPSDRFGLKWLRADLPLMPGYVVTIEPGIYFIAALLSDPDVRSRFRDEVSWETVDRLREFGGIRIEDDVLVTGEGASVLTADIPKSVEAIEELRARASG